jgi:para-aminobenzoate synthetase/4-amino-4-deoxychorismate lyase
VSETSTTMRSARSEKGSPAGDTYQVNYSFPVTSTSAAMLTRGIASLCLAQGAQYSAYIDLGRYKVLCLSPELFFKRRGNHVITKPMKGTVRRGRWPEEDREAGPLAQHSRERSG